MVVFDCGSVSTNPNMAYDLWWLRRFVLMWVWSIGAISSINVWAMEAQLGSEFSEKAEEATVLDDNPELATQTPPEANEISKQTVSSDPLNLTTFPSTADSCQPVNQDANNGNNTDNVHTKHVSKKSRRVTFPENGSVVTGYMDPPNPWSAGGLGCEAWSCQTTKHVINASNWTGTHLPKRLWTNNPNFLKEIVLFSVEKHQ